MESAEGVLERARSRARFEAAQIRQQAKAEAELASAAVLERARTEAAEERERLLAEAVAEAKRMKGLMLQEAQEDAFHEGALAREEVAAQAQQLIAEAQRDAAALLERALRDAEMARERATSEAERVKAAIIDHTHETAQSDAVRLRMEAIRDVERLGAGMLDEARTQAEAIRSEAEREKRAVLEQAEDEAARIQLQAAEQLGRLGGDDSDVKLLRADEIGSREFPQARNGFDRPSVRKWLDLVQRSYTVLEQELVRARRAWDQALDVIEAARSGTDAPFVDRRSVQAFLEQQLQSGRVEWAESTEVLRATSAHKDDYDLASLLVQACQLQSRLEKRPFGYSCPQVRALLDTLTIELARVRNQLGTLSAENEGLRRRLLARPLSPAPEGIASCDASVHTAAVPCRPVTTLASLNGSRPSLGRGGYAPDDAAG